MQQDKKKPRHAPGDAVRLWKPRHTEHGMKATVAEVMPISEYGGPEHRGPHAYRPTKAGWRHSDGFGFGGPLPDAMVISEDDYQKARADVSEFQRKHQWPE